uniref:Uncharacterized protein MANES_01G101700 n=1 Tax=Rhizophora mucronata TaxID=61149 RepID=A0A2P2MKP5_RHIMU
MKCPTFLLVSGLLVVLLTLVSPKACVASSNITTSLGMSMAESNLDSEFVMGSEFHRLLSMSGYHIHSLDPSQAPFSQGRYQQYGLPGKNFGSKKEKYNPYKHARLGSS